jgi:hypothetical protein
MDVVRAAADEGGQGQDEQRTQWSARSYPADVGDSGLRDRELRIAEKKADM